MSDILDHVIILHAIIPSQIFLVYFNFKTVKLVLGLHSTNFFVSTRLYPYLSIRYMILVEVLSRKAPLVMTSCNLINISQNTSSHRYHCTSHVLLILFQFCGTNSTSITFMGIQFVLILSVTE